MNLKKEKKKFLRGMREWDSVSKKDADAQRQWALDNSVIAAVRRNPVYSPKGNLAHRCDFRDSWKLAMRKAGMPFEKGAKFSEARHIKTIGAVADSLSKSHGKLLRRKKMRFGTSQKALNLYFKYLWCLDMISEPPHCPLDGIILKQADVPGNWTQSDSVPEYKEWIAACRKAAGKESLAVWELCTWE